MLGIDAVELGQGAGPGWTETDRAGPCGPRSDGGGTDTTRGDAVRRRPSWVMRVDQA